MGTSFRSCPVCRGSGHVQITCARCNGGGSIDTTLAEAARAAVAAYRKFIAKDDLDQLQVAITELQEALK